VKSIPKPMTAVMAKLLVGKARQTDRELMDSAESPIESLFLATAVVRGYGDRIQQQVQIGRYRADFVFDGWLVVEVDGWEFHYEHRHQVEADRRRDRRIVAEGYVVARFPGWQVWEDADECIDELDRMLKARAHRARSET